MKNIFSKPLMDPKKFYKKMMFNLLFAFIVLSISLAIGVFGYHILAHLGYVDSFLNASMILGGMGPVDVLTDKASKIFAGCYALFSGITFLSTFALLITPVAHRIIHKMHLETDDEETKQEEGDKD